MTLAPLSPKRVQRRRVRSDGWPSVVPSHPSIGKMAQRFPADKTPRLMGLARIGRGFRVNHRVETQRQSERVNPRREGIGGLEARDPGIRHGADCISYRTELVRPLSRSSPARFGSILRLPGASARLRADDTRDAHRPDAEFEDNRAHWRPSARCVRWLPVAAAPQGSGVLDRSPAVRDQPPAAQGHRRGVGTLARDAPAARDGEPETVPPARLR